MTARADPAAAKGERDGFLAIAGKQVLNESRMLYPCHAQLYVTIHFANSLSSQ
jgi:hypothetical protein